MSSSPVAAGATAICPESRDSTEPLTAAVSRSRTLMATVGPTCSSRIGLGPSCWPSETMRPVGATRSWSNSRALARTGMPSGRSCGSKRKMACRPNRYRRDRAIFRSTRSGCTSDWASGRGPGPSASCGLPGAGKPSPIWTPASGTASARARANTGASGFYSAARTANRLRRSRRARMDLASNPPGCSNRSRFPRRFRPASSAWPTASWGLFRAASRSTQSI